MEMLGNRRILLLIVSFSLGAANPADEAWKTKSAAEWSEQEAKEVLANSPWSVTTAPAIKKEEKRSHGLKGIGVAGIGRHRSNDPSEDPKNSVDPPDSQLSLHLRWESALPIREAELKARETNAPAVDEDRYAIAVYGIPNHFTKDPQKAGDQLKGQASLKREGQKDIKPSHVDVIQRDDGLVIVFLFPKTKEITAQDSQVEFNSLIGPYQISQPFHVSEMVYQGKLEL